MILTLLSIFRASQALQGVVVLIIALFGFKAWQMHERKLGAERFAAKQERKANEDAKQADEVRDAVASSKPFSGLRDPNRRDAGNKP